MQVVTIIASMIDSSLQFMHVPPPNVEISLWRSEVFGGTRSGVPSSLATAGRPVSIDRI